jgi:protocatechuate 3,4-dioxygenase beta subunit
VPVLWGFPDDSLLSGETQSIPDAIQLFQVASAEVTVELSSDNPAVLTIPPNITFPPTTDAASLTIQAASVTGPLQTVKIHATYAGTTLSSNIQIRPRPGIISGQVTDVSQNPIAGASVTIATNQFIFSNSSSVQLTTDSNGFYQSPQIPPGVYQISATLWGYVASEVFNVTADVGVPDMTQNITLIATKPFAISGKVTDLSGSAIPLATVAFNNSPVAKTGAQGDYSFSWDPGSAANDLPYTISVHQTGYTTGSLTIPIANGATITENFVLQLLGSLSGFVTDTSNTPIQGATVAAASGSVESDVSGQYVLAGLNPGANNISVKASGFDPLQTSVSVNPGPTITTQNLTLSKGSGVITGHVEIVGPQGDVSPLPHVAISVTELSSAQTFIRSETDADGNYTISNVPSGQASVSVIFRPSQTSVVEVSAHQTIVLNFVFQPKVLPPGPKPI